MVQVARILDEVKHAEGWDSKMEVAALYSHDVAGLYRHYKGGLYFVRGLAIDADSHDLLVEYADQYGRHCVRNAASWAKPLPDGASRFVRVT